MTGAVPSFALEAERVDVRYGRRAALDGLSLSVGRGEVFGLIGLNGAGKTTLIKAALDLVRPDAGTIRLFGRPSSDAPARAAVSFLPELFRPSALLTGWDFLALTLAFYGRALDRTRAVARARALAFDPDLLDQRVGTYSKGTGQKIGLIGALLPECPLLILDEPMSGLDPEARGALKRAFADEAAAGRTVFFSSHVLADVDEICHRIGVLHRGRLLFAGHPADFRAHHPGVTLEDAFLSAIAAPVPAA